MITFLKANIDMANVVALTNLPLIHISGDDDTTGDAESGELIIYDEIMKKVPVNSGYVHERYLMTATYYFDGTSETTFKEMLEEIDNTLITANKSGSRAYRYDMEYRWDTNINQSVAEITFLLVKEFVAL